MRKVSLKNLKYTPPCHRQMRGFTLIEIMITLTILAVVSSIATVSYNGYIDTTKNASAASQLRTLSLIINEYFSENGSYPASLNDIDNGGLLDPWGNPYQYLKFADNNLGSVRKDRNLVPLNSKFDLYSKGKDNDSRPPLAVPVSQDDIIVANDGGFIGIARNY